MFDLNVEMGIDLGTASVLVYVRKKGVVLNEPSVVALDKNTDKILAVGEEARQMLGRTPGNIVAIRPLKDGVISDFEITERMLKHFIQKACGTRRIFKPRVIICVPSGVTQVEKRAVIDAANQAGARKTYLIEEPVAAAIGAGLDISKPSGNMIADVGGGTTDVAVISLGGIVVNASIKIAGDKFDEAIIRYMRKKYNLLIGERTAEEMKIRIGSAFGSGNGESMEVRGRNLVTGLPKTHEVFSNEMVEALEEPVAAIVDTIHSVIEKTPPELAADISNSGVVLTGGGALLHGLDMLLNQRLGTPVRVADDPISCVAIGTGKALEAMDALEGRLVSTKGR
ncbi:MAG TPA: rod shape-determining protein [Bacillota bacterium]|jgi:rod shape-determining protein MreB|nr:rod shape-determining protein [Bacillota bacterium]